jgi:acetyl esterase
MSKLHPQVEALLRPMSGGPGPHELPLDVARAMLDSLDDLGGEKEPVAAVDDRSIAGPAGPIPIRVYRPSRDPGLPIAVFFHGGGFTMGSLASHDRLCRALANRSGCLVVAVDYRLAPEHRFPAGIEDAYAATAWIARHGSELGGDPDRIAVGGDSGGGTFGAIVCWLARERGGPPIQLQYLINPGGLDYVYSRPSCTENAEGYFLTMDAVRWIEGQYFADPADKSDPRAQLNLAGDLSGLPPAIVLTAECDPVRDQGVEYVRRLREARVTVRHTDYPGMIHGWVNFQSAIDAGRAGLDEIAAAIRSALQPLAI